MTDGVYEIGVTANADGVEAGVRQAKAALNGLGEAALREGERAGAGIAAVGDGGDQAASKVDRASRSIIASIQRATAVAEAGERNTSKYFEALANQRGVNTDVLRPYLSQLDDVIRQQNLAAAGLNGMNLSAGELKNALRSLPAQFTDIVTSLSSGQAPLTVFIQQGGQIKDQFGGAGAAVRAMGGYVAGLINPTNLLAAAAGALAVAYYQGSKESDALTNSILLTGNAAGTTTGQLNEMAKAIAGATGATQGATADALAQAVSSGKVAQANLQTVSEVAVRLQKVTGKAVSETVDEFVQLGKEPVKASEKLNEKYGYLTASIYQQIKALEDQGKVLEAGALAQEAYANAMSGRAKTIADNLGYLEGAWKGITQAAARAWDSMLGVGRESTIQEKIAEQKRLIQAIRDGSEPGNIDIAQKHLATLEALVKSENDRAKATANSNAQTKASIALSEEADKFLSKDEQKRREIAKLQQLYTEAVKGGTRSTAEIVAETKRYEAALAGIEDKYKEREKRTRKTGKSQEQKDAEELAAILDRISGKFSGLDANYYNDLQKLWKAYGSGKLSLDEYRVAVERMTGEQKFAKDAAKAQADAIKDFDKTLSDYIANHQKYLFNLDEEARKVEDQVLTYGLGKEALAQLTLARAQERLEMAKANGLRGNDLALLEQEVELRRRIASATSDLADKDANKRAAEKAAQEWQRVSDDIGRALTDSIFQGGKSGWEQLKKTIEATLIRATIQPVVTNAVGSVLQSAGFNTGANLAGAGNLLSAGSSLAGIGNLSSFMGASGYLQLGSMASSFGTGLTAAAGGADLSAAIAAYEAAGMGATATSLGAGASAAGMLGSSAGAIGSAMSALSAAAPYLAVGLFAAQQLGLFDGPTNHQGGAYSATTAGTTARLTTQNYAGFDLGWGAYNSDRSANFDEAMKNMAYGIATQIAQSVKTFGGDASGLTVASRFASDNSDYSVGALRVTDQAGKILFDLDKHYAAEAQKGMQEFAADTTRALVGALKATKLDGEFTSIFANIDPLTSSVESLNAALQQATAIQQTITSLRSSMDSAFLTQAEQLDKAFSKFGQSIPDSADSFERLVLAQDLNTAAGRDLAASLMQVYPLWGQVQDAAKQAADAAIEAAKQAADAQRAALMDAVTSARSGLIDSYQAEASALDSTAQRWRSFSSDIRKFRDSLTLGNLSPLTPGERYAEAAKQFRSTYAAAMSGDATAAGNLQSVAQAFLQASQTYNASGSQYIADFAQVQDALDNAAVSASASADVAQLQLNAAKDQLRLLGQIDSGTKSVADSINALSVAVMQAVAAGVNPGLSNVTALTGGVSDSWVNAGAGMQAWQSLGGAAATRTQSGMSVFGIDGTMRSAADLVGYWQSGISERQIYDSAKALGITLRELDDFLGFAPGTAERWARDQGLPTFAKGGYYSGGMALVGEAGPEVINFTNPGQILTAEQTRRALSGPDESALLAKIEALTDEVRQLRAQQRAETLALIDGQYRSADVITAGYETTRSRESWGQSNKPELR